MSRRARRNHLFQQIGTGIIKVGFLNAMQLFTVNITDLTEFDSPPCEEWLERDVVPYYAKLLARDVCRAMPDLLNKGMCIAVYDEAGLVNSVLPLHFPSLLSPRPSPPLPGGFFFLSCTTIT